MKKIAIVGSGNVAWHLCKNFLEKGLEICGVFSKNEEGRNRFADEFKIESFSNLEALVAAQADIILLAVNDDSIAKIANSIPENTAVAYTSGSVKLKSIEKKNCGVFYPLQSFTKGKDLNIFEVPFFIEADSSELAQSLFDLAWKLSRKVEFADSETRSELHLAAVFANNFTNYMFSISDDLLKNSKGKFEHLIPLITTSVAKLKDEKPSNLQTGPAVRKDLNVINKQYESLPEEYKSIYKLISDSILKKYHEKL